MSEQTVEMDVMEKPAVSESVTLVTVPTDNTEFLLDLASAINKNSRENGSDTPDFILAEFLSECLTAFDKCSRAREKWYGRSLSITRTEVDPEITASEALYGFTAWLATRQRSVTLGASHDCAPVAELLKLFLQENKLPEPRPLIYPDNIKMPKE